MLHRIDTAALGPTGTPMAKAVASCVHCGFCLPACPTYQLLGDEMDSPRGRIVLMKSVLEGTLSADEAAPHVDRCLGCLACVSACPSGVAYGNLLTPYRARVEAQRRRSAGARLVRWLALGTIPDVGRFRLAARAARWTRGLASLAPRSLRALWALLPDGLPDGRPLPAVAPAIGRRRARVVLWPGCAQEVLAPSINAAAIHMLTANGVEVVIPPSLGCCGAIAAHTGALEQASRLAARALEVLGRHTDVDGVITTAAGCGSGIHEYPVWLAGSGHEADAVRLAGRTVDVTVFLARLGLTTPLALEKPARVAYHDACHLLHGQGVREAPRDLLRAVDGLELVELDDEACCGSAGTFNLEQPDLAWTLGRRKAERIQALGVSEVATGNIGCLTQMHAHLAGASRPVRVRHTVEVLAEACRDV